MSLQNCTRIFNPTASFRQFSSKVALHCGKGGGSAGRHGASSEGEKGLILGVYTNETENGLEHKLSPAAESFNERVNGKLSGFLRNDYPLTLGRYKILKHLNEEFNAIALVGLGSEDSGFCALECLDTKRENIRIAAGIGAHKLREEGVSTIFTEGFDHSESAAEGASLSLWRYQDLNREQEPTPQLLLMDGDKNIFDRGLLKADAQNLARQLCETPPNIMTPYNFAHITQELLCPCGLKVEVRDREWIRNMNMNSFLAVAKGSCEMPCLIEASYCGLDSEEPPIVLTGKGITFDAGGLHLKRGGKEELRSEISGAAVIIAVMRAIARLSLPLNVEAVIPLCENMPSGMAMKPGDVVTSMSGKTIQIHNPDNEARLLLADALHYAITWLKPSLIIDIASLTPGMEAGLGASATGVYSNSHKMWNEMKRAGSVTGDRVWRFPLWQHFIKKVTSIESADVTNATYPNFLDDAGEPCVAAAFLNEFVPCSDWVHMDTTGTGMIAHDDGIPYLQKGRMTGRPTRTVLQFLYQLACCPEENDEKSGTPKSNNSEKSQKSSR